MEEEVEFNQSKEIPEITKLLTNKEQIPSDFIDKITDKVYLGDIDGASDFDYFSKENINNVLSIIKLN